MRTLVLTLLLSLCPSMCAQSDETPNREPDVQIADASKGQGNSQLAELVMTTTLALPSTTTLPGEAAPARLVPRSSSPPPTNLFIEPARKPGFKLASSTAHSSNFLAIQHAARIAFQKKTRDRIGGPFFKDYTKAVTRVNGFFDGDGWFTNFVGHPVEGATAYHIARINGATRVGGFWWSAAYSTQFELGPLSEASIGDVGVSPVDLIVTPVLGTLLGVAEEWLKERVDRAENRSLRILGRIALVGRAFAFLASGK